MPAHVRVGTLKTYIDGTRPRPFVRPVSKDVFLTLLSVYSNLANLNLGTEVMQQEASTWVDFISSCGQHPFIYIIRCTPLMGALCLCIYAWCGRGVCIYISLGVGRLYVAYPFQGAMLEPVIRDKRGEIHDSHVFFVSIRLV